MHIPPSYHKKSQGVEIIYNYNKVNYSDFPKELQTGNAESRNDRLNSWHLMLKDIIFWPL